ncbi:AMP-binding protein [Aureimonas jatrophae]|uniref:Fatty-acyl-CoA synthase n=1 Tax=Aureimonas jatrophae TaxID=1166073 RepID=A0A1H0KCS1_9HYPH|nr:AMP-binding protein [Aureimonas jatrophae]MBB3951058.1 fatty-acyl-CoA synthase [Aureimonas jatrophae]SDO53542.1 fatty-acyl-CoA synthase [Aureimonas jatrophae]
MQPFELTLNTFLDHAARWHPQTEVVTARQGETSRRIGYADLREGALRVLALLTELGVEPGDHVATLAWNSQTHMEVWYGIMGLGAACHTLNPRLTADQLAAMLRQSQARVAIVSADLLPLARQVAARIPLRSILVIDGGVEEVGEGVASLETLVATRRPAARWADVGEDAPSGLCFTSGTTGAPKGVAYTHRSSYLHTLRLLQADVMGFTARDTVLAAVPMFHANAWGLPFAAPAVGARLVLPGRHADGRSLATLIADEGVTVAVGVPTVWIGLLEHVETHGETLPSLERIVVGGSSMPAALMERLERVLGIVVQTSWGMTELSPLGTMASPATSRRDAGVSGRPSVGIDLLLTDAAGRPLPEQRGVEGHLRVRGPAVVERYFGQDEPVTDADGWFATGDLARLDAEGNLTITGRAKDLIKSGGEWINPAHIEEIVGALPEVSMAAVVGRTDPKWGERPILLVEMRKGADIDDLDLLGSLRGQVASWWIPETVIRLPEMPKAATGKIDKMRLRTLYSQAAG